MKNKFSIKILNASGKESGQFDLDPMLSSVGVKEAIVYDAVRAQRLRKRSGTHSCLSKGEMKGGNKKPWKQKGTGRARAGSNTSPIWVGGAVAHGPKPRKYDNRTMKRTLKQAVIGVFRTKAKAGEIICLEEMNAQKTAEFAKILGKLNILGKKVLFISSEVQQSSKVAGNVPGVKVIAAQAVNTYDLVNSDAVILTKQGLEQVHESLKAKALSI